MFLSKPARLRNVSWKPQWRWLRVQRKKTMANFKLLSAGLLATAMLTTPVLARQHHVRTHHIAESADPAVPAGAHYVGGRGCIPAPRVGAYATAPWENETPCAPVSAN
jgi:hypothetical protein